MEQGATREAGALTKEEPRVARRVVTSIKELECQTKTLTTNQSNSST
jgi:phage shock protein A